MLVGPGGDASDASQSAPKLGSLRRGSGFCAGKSRLPGKGLAVLRGPGGEGQAPALRVPDVGPAAPPAPTDALTKWRRNGWRHGDEAACASEESVGFPLAHPLPGYASLIPFCAHSDRMVGRAAIAQSVEPREDTQWRDHPEYRGRMLKGLPFELSRGQLRLRGI